MVIVAALGGTLHAADALNTTTTDTSRAQWQNDHRLGKMERADKIIGREITDPQNQKLGRVKDLAIDLQNGRIVEVIVGTGGVLGMDERYVAVPPGSFTCDPDTKTLRLNADKTKLSEAPAFKFSDWQANVGQDTVGQVYQYYGMTPYYGGASQTAQEVQSSDQSHAAAAAMAQQQNPPVQMGEVTRADKVMGSTVHNLQNERLGKVSDLVIDLPAGRVVEVILASGGFLGIADELSAVPPQAFRPDRA